MNQIIINGGSLRYLSELPQFKNGLPDGIINKTKPDVGGTYIAANCDKNYIIVCPFKDLVDSIAADTNNKYEVFKCYGGIYEADWRKYENNHKIKKIAVTYDSFSKKLIKWINPKDYYVVVDEYHLLLSEMDYREDAINGLIETIKSFKHYSFLSATPIDVNFEVDAFKNLPHYKITWDESDTVKVFRFKASKLIAGVANFINKFLKEGISINGVDVEQLFVFFNSVTGIEQMVRSLDLSPDTVKICCANTKRNRLILDEYEVEPVTNPNKKLNFFTKKGFQGCNLFSNNALVVVVSDGFRDSSLIDISTTLEQIVGRLRENKEYHNIFRNFLIHFYSTNNHIMSNDEFTQLMNEKEEDAKLKLSGWNKMNDKEKISFSKSLNLTKDLVSIYDGNIMKYNPLKKEYFKYMQKVRNQYKDGFCVRDTYKDSKRFEASNQQIWDDFSLKVKKALVVSYQTLLKNYIRTNDEEYLVDNPEFKTFCYYLKETEMNSLRWNKEKMLARCEDYRKLDDLFRKIYKKNKFYSNDSLREYFINEFPKLYINLKPKSTLIESHNNIFTVNPVRERIDGRMTRGYRVENLKLMNNE